MTALDIAIIIIRNALIVFIVLNMVPLLVWVERKGSAYIQDRPGPERAAIGPFRMAGLFHLLADAIKMLSKEDIIPSSANRFYYLLAPVIVVAVGFTTVAIVPFFDNIILPNGFVIGGQMINIDPGILWFFAMVSLSVYGIIFAGWSSGSKFSLLGAMRASAAVMSYEIPMGLAVISVVMMYGTVGLPGMVHAQMGSWWGWLPKWGIFVQPLAALIFIVCAFAETNRVPFDLAEAEGELVAGYHTEYSAMKFGMFFLGEYAAMVVSSALIITLFFGGWQVPWLSTAQLAFHSQLFSQWIFGLLFGAGLVGAAVCLGNFQASIGRFKDWRDYEGLLLAGANVGLAVVCMFLLYFFMAIHVPAWYGPVFAALIQFVAFMIKVLLMCWVFVWVRWTLPRFRYDQLMNLGWKSLLPLALFNILLTGVVIMVLHQ
jgi:NADH-quinone oxidoreductase subunit H